MCTEAYLHKNRHESVERRELDSAHREGEQAKLESQDVTALLLGRGDDAYNEALQTP